MPAAPIAVVLIGHDAIATRDITLGRLCPDAQPTSRVIALGIHDDGTTNLLTPALPLHALANHFVRGLWPDRPGTTDGAALLRQEIWTTRALLGDADANVNVYRYADRATTTVFQPVLDDTPHLDVRPTAPVSILAALDSVPTATTTSLSAITATPPRTPTLKGSTMSATRFLPHSAASPMARARGVYLALAIACGLSLAVWLMPFVATVFAGTVGRLLPLPLYQLLWEMARWQFNPLGFAHLAVLCWCLLVIPKAVNGLSDGLVTVGCLDAIAVLAMMVHDPTTASSNLERWITAGAAVLLGAYVVVTLTSRPRQALWIRPYGTTWSGAISPMLLVAVCASGIVPVTVGVTAGRALDGLVRAVAPGFDAGPVARLADGLATGPVTGGVAESVRDALFSDGGIAAWIAGAAIIVCIWLLARLRAPRLLGTACAVVWLLVAIRLSPVGGTVETAIASFIDLIRQWFADLPAAIEAMIP